MSTLYVALVCAIAEVNPARFRLAIASDSEPNETAMPFTALRTCVLCAWGPCLASSSDDVRSRAAIALSNGLRWGDQRAVPAAT